MINGLPDTPIAIGPRRLVEQRIKVASPRISVCTLVTRAAEWDNMYSSFSSHGFDGDCEYLVIDNVGTNRADAFIGINEFLQTAAGQIIIVCHQDVRLLNDGRQQFDAVVDELTMTDPHWAIAGNAGMSSEGWPITCLSDPAFDLNVFGGPLPARVMVLDENFLVIRSEANLCLSRDLTGFHHYGADLCLLGRLLGWNAYVIDFFLRHESAGTVDATYFRSLEAFELKYADLFALRRMPLVTGEEAWFARRKWTANWLDRWDKLIGRRPRNRMLWDERRRTASERHKIALEKRESGLPR